MQLVVVGLLGISQFHQVVKAFSPISYSPNSRNRSCILNMTDKELQTNLRIVIAGAGVIGTSTAYYLAQNHVDQISSITLVDPTASIAPAASGKAGGFLALDWNDYSPAGPIARRSFDLHQSLADTLGAEKIMYRRLTCASISVNESGGKSKPSGKKLEGIEWVDDVATKVRQLGDESTIAQVHPKMLCEAMWEYVHAQDGFESELRCGKVVEAMYEGSDDKKKLVGAKLDDGTSIKADVILFACGPWTEFGNMMGVKYHSVIIETPRVLNQSVFFDGCGDPEVYPRPDGTAYCCGFPDPTVRVTEQPGQEEVRDAAVQRIVNAVREASCVDGKDGVLGQEPVLSQSCYLPTTSDNIPIIGELPGQKRCFVAAGHGCWGILMGPATGEAMASLISTGESTKLDLMPFRPDRFQHMF